MVCVIKNGLVRIGHHVLIALLTNVIGVVINGGTHKILMIDMRKIVIGIILKMILMHGFDHNALVKRLGLMMNKEDFIVDKLSLLLIPLGVISIFKCSIELGSFFIYNEVLFWFGVITIIIGIGMYCYAQKILKPSLSQQNNSTVMLNEK